MFMKEILMCNYNHIPNNINISKLISISNNVKLDREINELKPLPNIQSMKLKKYEYFELYSQQLESYDLESIINKYVKYNDVLVYSDDDLIYKEFLIKYISKLDINMIIKEI